MALRRRRRTGEAGWPFLFDPRSTGEARQPGNRGGESETVIGEWFKSSGKRDRVVIATKCGMEMGPDQTGLSKKAIMTAVDASLKRLQTDHIDLYMAHKDDESTPLEETVGAFDELVKAGKIRYAGAATFHSSRTTTCTTARSSRASFNSSA